MTGPAVDALAVASAAITDLVRAAVRDALAEAVPRLAYPQVEVAHMLGVSPATIGSWVADGRLHRIGGQKGPITLVSVLELVGWPLAAAPLVAPLRAVPGEVAS